MVPVFRPTDSSERSDTCWTSFAFFPRVKISAPVLTISITSLFKRKGLSPKIMFKQPWMTGSCFPSLISNRKLFTVTSEGFFVCGFIFAINTIYLSIPIKEIILCLPVFMLGTCTVLYQCIPTCWVHALSYTSVSHYVGDMHCTIPMYPFMLGTCTLLYQCIPLCWGHAQPPKYPQDLPNVGMLLHTVLLSPALGSNKGIL